MPRFLNLMATHYGFRVSRFFLHPVMFSSMQKAARRQPRTDFQIKALHLITKSFRFFGRVVKYGCILYCFQAYFVDFVVCIGPSMEPAIFSHDIVLTERLTQRFGELRRGDLVVARSPMDPGTIVCKRIVAKHGDLVYDEHNTIVKIPRGKVWLLGDNSANSIDSRRYGAVPEGLIQAKVFARIWPPNRAGIVEGTRKAVMEYEECVDER